MTIWQFYAAIGGFKDFNTPAQNEGGPRGEPTEEEYDAMMRRMGFA